MDCLSNTDGTSFEIGFGSINLPKELLPAFLHDHGFGAPPEVSYAPDSSNPNQHDCFRNTAEEGFGDPFSFKGFKLPPRVGLTGERVEFSDNGGQLGILYADFISGFKDPNFGRLEPIGPFKARIVNKVSGEEHQCFSAIPGQGASLFTTTNQDKLYFALPFAAKGIYTFILTWLDENITRNLVLNDAIKLLHRQRNDKTMSVRANLPDFWNAGPRSDNYNSPDLYIPNESTNAVLTSMTGEVFNHLWFNDYTISTTMYTTDDTTLLVESTLGFPKSGFFIVDGLKVSYTGKTDTSFTGVSGIDKIIHPTTRVYFDHQEVSEIDNYWKILNNKLYKPAYVINDVSWLKAFNAIEFGEHVCWTVLFDYYMHLFDIVTVQYDVLVTAGGLITPVAAADAEVASNPTFQNRLVEIDGKIFFTQTTSGTGNSLILDRVGCTYWNGFYPRGDVTQTPNIAVNTTYKAKFLPYIIQQDYDGEFIFTLEETSLPDVSGFIDRDFIDFNIYFGGSELGPQTDLNLNRLLAAGIKGFIKRSVQFNATNVWPATFPGFPNPRQNVIEPDNVFDDQAP